MKSLNQIDLADEYADKLYKLVPSKYSIDFHRVKKLLSLNNNLDNILEYIDSIFPKNNIQLKIPNQPWASISSENIPSSFQYYLGCNLWGKSHIYLEPFRSVCWESVYKSISYFADDSDKTVLYMHTTLESVDTLKSIL